jgi:hypothetical protein
VSAAAIALYPRIVNSRSKLRRACRVIGLVPGSGEGCAP